MMRSNLKPPLARSPIRIRSRRVLQPTSNSIQTPPGKTGYMTKTHTPNLGEETGIRKDYRTVASDLRVLAKMVQQDLGKEVEMDYDVAAFSDVGACRSPLFERGRFYDEYARRRNERLRKKKGEKVEEKKPVYDLGVRTEAGKRRGEARKYESARKGVTPSTPATQRKEPTTATRYLLRSSTTSKENKRPALAYSSSFTAGMGEKKFGARRTGRI